MKHVCPRCFVAEDAEYEGQSVIDPKAYPIEKKYAEFNARFFNNRLPKIKLGLAQMKGLAGRVRYSVERLPGTKAPDPRYVKMGLADKYAGVVIKPGSMTLQISKEFRRPERAFDAILLHEMIHVVMAVDGKFAENHGPSFTKMAAQISSAAGMTVPGKTCPRDEFAVPVSDVPKPLGVVLLQRPGNRFSFALLNENTALKGADDLEKLFSYAVKIGQLVSASIWVVAGPAWTAIARDMTVGRVLTHKIKFFILDAKDMPLLDELKHRGDLLRTIGTRPLSEKARHAHR